MPRLPRPVAAESALKLPPSIRFSPTTLKPSAASKPCARSTASPSSRRGMPRLPREEARRRLEAEAAAARLPLLLRVAAVAAPDVALAPVLALDAEKLLPAR